MGCNSQPTTSGTPRTYPANGLLMALKFRPGTGGTIRSACSRTFSFERRRNGFNSLYEGGHRLDAAGLALAAARLLI
jgi:hypothetical protein